jgi:hypothetical protein
MFHQQAMAVTVTVQQNKTSNLTNRGFNNKNTSNTLPVFHSQTSKKFQHLSKLTSTNKDP